MASESKEKILLLGQHALPASVALLCFGLAVGGEAASQWLRFDRAAISAGQIWRILSGNLVHLGWSHLWMNLAGLALIWAIFYRQLGLYQWLVALTVSCLGVGFGLFFLNPELQWYVGLSGALHGLFVLGIIVSLTRGYRLEWLLLAFLAAKLMWEQWIGAVPGTAEVAGGPVVVDSHLYGAIAGLVLALIFVVFDRRTTRHEG